MSDAENAPLNVHDEPLTPCSLDPETGYERDGYCRDVLEDRGRHQLCAVVTEAFLEYSAERGNDLTTPRPELDFPGLEPGDRWCVCVPRWLEAHEDGVAPPIVPEATSKSVLTHVPRETIEAYAEEASGEGVGSDRASEGDGGSGEGGIGEEDGTGEDDGTGGDGGIGEDDRN